MPIPVKTDLAKLVNQLLDTVFVVDEAGHIVFVSQSCKALLGYGQEELVGTFIQELMHPEDIERTLAAAQRVMDGKSHTDFENRYLHKNGQAVDLQWSARWASEEKLRIAVARDITGLKNAQRFRAALYMVTQAAHSADNLSALCQVITEVVTPLPWIEQLHILFFDKKSQRLYHPLGPASTDGPLRPGTALEKVLGKGIAIKARRHPHLPAQGQLRAGPSNWLAVPLLRSQEVLGAVVLEFSEKVSANAREQLQFLASQLAATLERKQADDHLRYLAHHDALTGLANRARFYEQLQNHLTQQQPLALLYLDLDDFKAINDNFGHHWGDQLLCEVACRLRQNAPADAVVTRMGGDEFTLLLPGQYSNESLAVQLRCLKAAMALPFDIGGQPLRVSFSLGFALSPQQGVEPEQLMRQADGAMYRQKHQRQA